MHLCIQIKATKAKNEKDYKNGFDFHKSSPLLISIIKTVRRRVDENFAVSALGAIIKTLETRYDYFKFISVDIDPIEGININVSSNVNHVNPTQFARAIEIIVQIIYFDLKGYSVTYLILIYDKSNVENLTPSQTKSIKELIEGIKNGHKKKKENRHYKR